MLALLRQAADASALLGLHSGKTATAAFRCPLAILREIEHTALSMQGSCFGRQNGLVLPIRTVQKGQSPISLASRGHLQSGTLTGRRVRGSPFCVAVVALVLRSDDEAHTMPLKS